MNNLSATEGGWQKYERRSSWIVSTTHSCTCLGSTSVIMVCIRTAARGAHFISMRRIAPTSLAEYFRLTVRGGKGKRVRSERR